MSGPDVSAAAQADTFTAGIVSPEAALTRHRADWQALADRIAEATFFMYPAAFGAWHDTVRKQSDARVILVRDAGRRLVAVMPVVLARVWRGPSFEPRIDYTPEDSDLAPAGRLQFPLRQGSTVVSWRAATIRPTLLCAAPDLPRATAAVAAAMAGMPGIDQIVLPVLEDDARYWLDGFRAAGLSPWVHHLGRSVLTLRDVRGFDELVAARNANFRKNIRRASAAATAAGLEFEVHAGRAAVAAQLGVLERLAAESWKAADHHPDGAAIPYAGVQQAYFTRILNDPSCAMTPVLCIGAANGAPASAALTFCHGQTMTGFLTYRNALLPSASPGLLGIGALLDWCAQNGIRVFDLNSTQDWMRHLSDTRQKMVNIAAFRPTLRGRVYGHIARIRHRSRPNDAT